MSGKKTTRTALAAGTPEWCGRPVPAAAARPVSRAARRQHSAPLGHVPGLDPPCCSVPGGPGGGRVSRCEERPASTGCHRGSVARPRGTTGPGLRKSIAAPRRVRLRRLRRPRTRRDYMCMGSASCWVSHCDSSAVARVSVMSRASVLTMPAGVCAGGQSRTRSGNQSRRRQLV